MQNSIVIGIVVAGLLTAGCAAHWSRPGTPESIAEQDQEQCRLAAAAGRADAPAMPPAADAPREVFTCPFGDAGCLGAPNRYMPLPNQDLEAANRRRAYHCR